MMRDYQGFWIVFNMNGDALKYFNIFWHGHKLLFAEE